MAWEHKRSNYLINPKFQWDLIKKFILLTFFNILSFYWIVYYFFFNLESKAKIIGLVKDHPFYLFLDEQKLLMLILFLIVSIINISIIMLTGIFISHRVAGPLYRLQKFLEDENIKTAERISFRKDDYFLELEEALNKFIFRHKKIDDAESQNSPASSKKDEDKE